MPIYVFFNKSTGAIVHTHREVSLTGNELSLPREDVESGALVKLLEGRVDTDDVGVLEIRRGTHLLRRSVDPDRATEVYVDVEQGTLAERSKEKAS
jgi:hypothetical protein